MSTSTQISKRALSAGLGVGALALLAQRASADTSFTSFAFPATGAPASRTMPDRLAEIRNVKDFGAVGNGSADDTSAIQAAINAALTTGVNAQGNLFGTDVYFPAGVYKITASLNDGRATHGSVRLIGSGGNYTLITGSFAGYLIDKQDNGTTDTIKHIEGLGLKNTSTSAGAGCIRLEGVTEGAIRRCGIQGFIGISLSSNSTNITVSECGVSGLSAGALSAVYTGSIGILTTQNAIYDCAVTGFDHGIRAFNAGLTIINCRLEKNNTGIVLGKNAAGSSVGVLGVAVSGLTMESNGIGIWVNASGVSITGATISGAAAGAPGGGNPQYGIQFSNCTGGFFGGIVVSIVSCDIAGIDVSSTSGTAICFEGVIINNGGSGVNWKTAANGSPALSFINCSQGSPATPAPANVLLFANLPATPIEGMEFDITDSNMATWGATAAGGGSNHVKVRYNGSAWTVTGK